MRIIFTIAQKEFKAYFTSVKGGTIFWFFLLFMGIFFHSFIYTFIELEQKALKMGGESPNLSQLITAIFYNVQFILLLVIPAVTMASFSEEKRNQTIKLLQISPINALEIVLGKFIACIGLMFLVLTSSFLFYGFLLYYGNPDIGPILTSYLGIFLLICAQVAFGIWISSMTKNQFLAFLFTIFGLFFLLILNWIAPNITTDGVIENTIRYLASTTHLEVFIRGMLTVSDVSYFILFTITFLFFTNVVLDLERWR